VRNLRLLSPPAETTARLRVEYPERSPSHSSYIWDREMDGPEDVVVTREPARRSGREYLNLLLRAASWALVAYVFVEIVVVGTKPGLDELDWRGYLGLSLGCAICALDPDVRMALRTFFQVLRQGPPGGGPQRPAAA
jgi:hypothetical protein